MRAVVPGEGILMCGWPDGCGNHEIDGLGFCLHHVPDENLEEAEEITGIRRCRNSSGCRQYAVKGTSPPACKTHGANLGSGMSRGAARSVVEGRVMDRMVQIMSEHGDRLLAPAPVANPLTELLGLAGEMAEWKKIMQEIVAYLLSQERTRYAHDRVGEQLRAEVLLYERAIERLAKLYMGIIKLGIEARLAQITEEQIGRIERALDVVLAGMGLGLVEQETARQTLHRELTRAS
jgi:hypothetical protein